jgi:RNA polymerase sigma-70 factor, ECF subfamily
MGLADDRAAFDRLMVEHLPSAQRFAIRLCGDAEAAQDLVQEAMVRAARSWHTYRGEARFTTWLFRIVISAFRDQHEKLRLAGDVGDDVVDRHARDPAQDAAAAEFGRIVAMHVSRLPPRQREVIVLSAYEQLAIGEIATVLEISEQNVRTNLHLARERLREQLSRYVGGEKR